MQHRRFLVGIAALTALCAAACGGADEPGASTSGTPGTDDATRVNSGPGAFAAAAYTTDLTTICPDPIVVQSDWFPEPEHGAIYQLIGSGGTVNPDNGVYRGKLGSTGVDLEIRSGGPYLGGQPNVAVLYQDDSITLAFGSTDMSVQFSADLPTVSVVSPLDISPAMLMWDPDDFQFDEFADIGASDATVLVYDPTASYFLYLVGEGLIRSEQLDGSYDGSPARFVTEDGLVQVGFVTNEVYRYEHEVAEWGKPVDYLLLDEAGFRTYQGSLMARAAGVDELAPCLAALVPMIQQAQVDYIDDPAEVNAELVRIVGELASFWSLSEEGVMASVESMRDLGIVGNGPDETLGNFDEQRVQQLIDDLIPIYERTGVTTHDRDVTVDDVVTNEFIDPDIGR